MIWYCFTGQMNVNLCQPFCWRSTKYPGFACQIRMDFLLLSLRLWGKPSQKVGKRAIPVFLDDILCIDMCVCGKQTCEMYFFKKSCWCQCALPHLRRPKRTNVREARDGGATLPTGMQHKVAGRRSASLPYLFLGFADFAGPWPERKSPNFVFSHGL